MHTSGSDETVQSIATSHTSVSSKIFVFDCSSVTRKQTYGFYIHTTQSLIYTQSIQPNGKGIFQEEGKSTVFALSEHSLTQTCSKTKHMQKN